MLKPLRSEKSFLKLKEVVESCAYTKVKKHRSWPYNDNFRPSCLSAIATSKLRMHYIGVTILVC